MIGWKEMKKLYTKAWNKNTARLLRGWSSQLFHGRPGGRRHVRSGGRLSDTLMWSWRAMFAGVSSSSRATCPNTEMRRRDRRCDSEVRPVRWSTSSSRTRSYHRIPSSCRKKTQETFLRAQRAAKHGVCVNGPLDVEEMWRRGRLYILTVG